MRLVRSVHLILLTALCLSGALHAQGADEGIRVSAAVAPLKVPQNREAVVTVRLEWAGDLDRYEIRRFDNPLVENLNIVGTSTSNRVQVVGGLTVARQEYLYRVMPEALGMAYIDGIVIRYTDRETGKEYPLHTSRLELEVIDPLPEPGSYLWLVFLLAFILAAAIAFYLVRRMRARRAEAAARAQTALASQVILEEKYAERLRVEVDLRRPDLEVNEALARLAGLLRRYLAEKYSLPLISATTSEVRTLMAEAGAPESAISDALAVLEIADLAKFSGAAQPRSGLERAYTILEKWLA